MHDTHAIPMQGEYIDIGESIAPYVQSLVSHREKPMVTWDEYLAFCRTGQTESTREASNAYAVDALARLKEHGIDY